ncbi:unnamed protein product [Linum trigynum]
MARIVEDQIVEFSLDEVQSVKFRTSRTLLGRVFSENKFTPSELREGLIEAWRVQGNLRVSATKYGLFEIVLPSEETSVWILKRSPWIVKDRILHLRSWTAAITRPVFDDLATAPFRVQIWNVKEDCCTKQFGRKIAAGTIGQVLEADVFASRETEECFVKVHALINFTKPLRSQLMAVSQELGKFWVNFKYEFLPTFCYLCGRVGHSKPDCVFDPPSGQERFGPHMSTRKLGRKIYMDEEELPKPHHTSKSVWVNRNVQVQKEGYARNARPREIRPVSIDRSIDQTARQQEDHGCMEPQPRVQEAKPKLVGNRASPKKVVVKAPSRVKIGGGVRLHQKKVAPRENGPLPKKSSKGRQQMGRQARKVGNRQQTEDQVEQVFEETRKRRLILQEESEEEEEADVKGAQSDQRVRPRLKKGGVEVRRAKSKKDGGASQYGDTQELEDEEVEVSRDDEGRRLVMESEDDQSNDEQLPFEIKRRSPGGASKETRRILSGRVHQVVEAFEAGLVFAQEEEIPITGTRSTLNEYGSNLMDPAVDTRKRAIDDLEG